MDLMPSVKEYIEAEAARVPVARLEAAAGEISARYRGERVPGKRLVSSAVDVLAYAAVRMPATYAAVSSALRLSGLSGVRTLLDVGAGTGAASIAAGELFDLSAIFCLEREGEMRKLGEKLLSLSDCGARTEWRPFELGSSRLTLRADLVTAAYLLNELPERELDDAVEGLWSAADKALLLVEPGTPDGFRTLMRARRRLIRLGACVAAPCTHAKECPLLRDDWCAFSCRVSRSRLHMRLKGGEVPYEDEKFCFLAVTRAPLPMAESRVLRHPQIAPGRVQLTLCTPEGIVNRSVSKKDGALFKQARKASAGDAFGLCGGEAADHSED